MSEATEGSIEFYLPAAGYPAHFPRSGGVQSHHGLPNDCPPGFEENLRRSQWKADQMRRVLSAKVGQDCWIRQTYGFRSVAENKACGSLVNPSAHTIALGTDLVPNPDLFTLRAAWDILRVCDEFMGGDCPVDQLIIERGCIHTGLALPWHDNKARGELRLDVSIPDKDHPGQMKRTYPLFGLWTPATSKGAQS